MFDEYRKWVKSSEFLKKEKRFYFFIIGFLVIFFLIVVILIIFSGSISIKSILSIFLVDRAYISGLMLPDIHPYIFSIG